MDRSAFLTFVGHVTDDGEHMLVTGLNGEVRLRGTPDELQAVRDLLRAMDGYAAAGSLVGGGATMQSQQEALLTALEDVGAVLNRGRAWSWFHAISSNPSTVPICRDPMTAYDLPRLALGGDAVNVVQAPAAPSQLDELAHQRRSVDLYSAALTPAASLRSAIRLATDAYMPRPDGSRPAASGGALYPLHFWVVGSDDVAVPKRILGIDHDHCHVKQCGEIGLADLQKMFVPDHGVAAALDRGAAVIVIAADPRRVTHKYGNRGWRYALMECGAVMHHIMLAATSRKEAIRPIGGYYDAALGKAVCDPALPLLTIFVAVE